VAPVEVSGRVRFSNTRAASACMPSCRLVETSLRAFARHCSEEEIGHWHLPTSASWQWPVRCPNKGSLGTASALSRLSSRIEVVFTGQLGSLSSRASDSRLTGDLAPGPGLLHD